MAAIADYIQALSIGTDAYGLMTAAGVSIATSLTAGAWGRK